MSNLSLGSFRTTIMVMVTFKIGQKVLILFMAVALGPLLLVNFVLLGLAQNQFKQEAVGRQKIVAEKTAAGVDNFLASKVDILIFQTQTSVIRQFNVPDTELNLAALIKQDRDMERVALVDKKGQEQVVVNQAGLVAQHANVASSDAFKAATFLAGKEYISHVTYDNAGQPHLTIGVPVIRFTQQQDLTNLSTAEFGKYRTPDDIQGVIIASFNISNLWQSVLSTKIGTDGYAFVVDDKGNLIAHPDSKFLAAHQNIADLHQVQHFLQGKHDNHETVSERGVDVFSTYQPITRTNWAVIVQEPLSSVLASTQAFYRVGLEIAVGIAALAIGLSLLFKRQLLTPIRQLAAAARRIGSGEFSHKIPVRNKDELGELAQTFNSMGQNIQKLVDDLQTQNVYLAEEQRKLSSTISSVSDGVIAINDAQTIITINPPASRLLRKHPGELIGKTLSDCFGWTQGGQPFKLNLLRPGTYHFENVMLPQAEQVAYLDLVITVLEHKTSDISAIITIHDQTPDREFEVMKLDFVSIAAHELRTPLTVIRGYLNLMNTDAINQLSIYNIENLQRAIIGAEQLSKLINNLLNVSRIERGQMHIALSKVDIGRLLTQIVREQQVTVKLKGQKLIFEPVSSAVYVPADRSALSEVINNLTSNASRYTPLGSTITVGLHVDGQTVRVEVTDNGVGIPAAAQDRLFTKFYRVERSMTSGNRGTGLGLYISKRIVQLHHGEIGVISKVGEGSTFYFTLPLYNEALHGKLIIGAKESVGIHGWITKRSAG